MKKFMIALLISLFVVSQSFATPPPGKGKPEDRGKCWTKKVKGDCPDELPPPEILPLECLGFIVPGGPCAT